MTDEIAMQKARELAAAEAEAAGSPEDAFIYFSGSRDDNWAMQALAKHLREVSDVVEAIKADIIKGCDHNLAAPLSALSRIEEKLASVSFILAKPKSNPLVEAIRALKDGRAGSTPESYAACLRAELAAQGIKLVSEG